MGAINLAFFLWQVSETWLVCVFSNLQNSLVFCGTIKYKHKKFNAKYLCVFYLEYLVFFVIWEKLPNKISQFPNYQTNLGGLCEKMHKVDTGNAWRCPSPNQSKQFVVFLVYKIFH
jgi:hypothetical protein